MNIIKRILKLKKRSHFKMFEILTGVSGYSLGTFLFVTGIRSTLGAPPAGCSAFIASVVGLTWNEYYVKLDMSYTKLKNCSYMFTIVLEKTLDKSMVDEKTRWKTRRGIEKIYNLYLDKHRAIKKSTEVPFF